MTQGELSTQLKTMVVYGAAGASVLNLAALLWVWGEWPQMAAIGIQWVVVVLLNVAVTHVVIPRVGVERGEDLRLIPNILAVAVIGVATRWSLVSLMFLPFIAVLIGGLQTRHGTRRLLAVLASISALALFDGALPFRVAFMAGLAVFWHLVSDQHTRFARTMLAERQRNLAELAAVHDELKVAHQSAIASEKLASIGMVASGVAHEINNPMSFITANVRALLEDLRAEQLLSKVMIEYRDEIIPGTLDGVRRVNAIVDDLRKFASGEPESPISFELSTELNAAVRMARPQLRGGQMLRTELQESPPLLGLPRQISQVALNLIVNAIQASGDRGEVVVSSGSSGGEAVFRVRDTGAGIAPEMMTRLFTPFSTTKAAGKGTGLGLAVAHGMIKAHGGRIVVSSEVGKGTLFEVFLPAFA